MDVLNVAGYKFVPLENLPDLRESCLAFGQGLGIKGTILLAPEGLNLFLAGAEESVRSFVTWLREVPEFTDLEIKESWSAVAPFRRFRVRLKKEIITLRHPTIRPHTSRAPAVTADTLRRWLEVGEDDQGRKVALLDTRNAYEVECGTFHGALDPGIRHFTEFPQALERLAPQLEEKIIVTFCTGGIRCEKAALLMQELGFQRVLQLEGGILKYFEETDGRFFKGSCFVFDERTALDAALRPSGS